MKRQKRIEKHGYKIIFDMSGQSVFAKKNNGLISVKGSSVTDLHRKIFGY
jgi:hypothetical protein